MTESGGIEFIRELLAEHREAGYFSADSIGILASIFESYVEEAPRGVTLGAAFGVEDDLSCRQWWHRERDREWRDALRDLAERLPAPSLPRQAARISQRLMRYMSGSRWQRDQRNGNGIDQALYRAATLAAGHGLSAKSICRAIRRT